MSKEALVIIIGLLMIFSGFLLFLNVRYEQRFDDLLESCPKPAIPAEVEPVFYIAAGTPMSRRTMVR